MLLVIPKFAMILFITGMIHHSIQISSYKSLIRTKRIANGYNVKIKKFPYFVSLITKKHSDDDMFPADLQFCGASIISNNYAISIASCLYKIYRMQVKVSEWFVRSGTTFWNATKRTTKHVRNHDVENFHVPAKWYIDAHSAAAEVALIQVKQPFRFPSVPIVIASPSFTIKPTKLMVVGFGETEVYYTSYRLKAAELHTVPLADCGSKYHMMAQNTLRCVRSSNKSTNICEGDYGGPVVQHRLGVPVLVGMAYRGPVNCGNPDKPAYIKEVSNIYVKSMVEYFQIGAKFTDDSFNN